MAIPQAGGTLEGRRPSKRIADAWPRLRRVALWIVLLAFAALEIWLSFQALFVW